MVGGIVNFILRCIKKGSGFEDVEKDVDKAKEKTLKLSKALMALGSAGNIVGRSLRAIATGGRGYERARTLPVGGPEAPGD